ncbi:MAG: GAF domain-containing protein, partial [Pseudomonadales bacterium]|nr:GAF domain-containing protein [Pseudomonadales bacterium]
MSTNNSAAPRPSNESERTKAVLDQELDYTETHRALADLTELAARVAGTDISLVNLIDSYTQWSISSFGIDLTQMPREESVCQYTILQDDAFEVKNLANDERFLNRPYVTGGPGLRYYYGVPLNSDGFNLGALCVLDRSAVELSDTQREMIELIAKAVVKRLELMRNVRALQSRLRRVGHDLRSPLFRI